jgi:spermidine synthase
MRVGVLGLGVGTLAAYGQTGDTYRFYEINPVVIDLANGQGDFFSFLADSPASIDLVLGDARISLEKELENGLENNFDILILDAFSSDSVPVHLLTQQAFDIYFQHIAIDGLIAANISNVRLDLRPVFWQLAQYYGLDMAIIHNPAGENNPDGFTSSWVLLTRNRKLLAAPALVERMAPLDDFRKNLRLWTDDYSNLFQIVK